MSTYQLPPEPDVDVVWTRYQDTGGVVRWEKQGAGWASPGHNLRNWLTLLAIGPVYDVHPDLCEWAPTPWRMNDGKDATVILDANGRGFNVYNDEISDLIVRAVNAYAERLDQP